MQKNIKRDFGTVRKLAPGKYLLRVSDGFDDYGKRRQPSKTVYCSCDREAERELIAFYYEVKNNAKFNLKGAPATLSDLYEEWFNNHVSTLEENTQKYYKSHWKNIELYGKIKLNTIRPSHIYDIISTLTSDKKKNATFKMLKSMFNKAVKWGYISDNPCNRVDTPKYEAAEKPVLTQKEIQLVMSVLPYEELKYQAMFYFAAMDSMRRQEIIALRRSCINFEEDSFRIKEAAFKDKDGKTRVKKTKTKKSKRNMALPLVLKNILIALFKEQDAERERLGTKWKGEEDNFIFTQWDGSIMCISTPTHWWRDFAEKHGINPTVAFHCLRHTAATYMIKNNVPITTVSGLLGHAKTSTTVNIYAHVIEGTKREGIISLENTYFSPVENTEKIKSVQ